MGCESFPDSRKGIQREQRQQEVAEWRRCTKHLSG
uniref:Uncharacterized protein n=1 Tax=Anguilla anguilla TaxID=7936 RepID=A0A0E9TSA0_ANGAN